MSEIENVSPNSLAERRGSDLPSLEFGSKNRILAMRSGVRLSPMYVLSPLNLDSKEGEDVDVLWDLKKEMDMNETPPMSPESVGSPIMWPIAESKQETTESILEKVT